MALCNVRFFIIFIIALVGHWRRLLTKPFCQNGFLNIINTIYTTRHIATKYSALQKERKKEITSLRAVGGAVAGQKSFEIQSVL